MSSLHAHEEGGVDDESAGDQGPPDEPLAGPERALFVFTVAGVALAVPALGVDAVAPLEELTAIPGAPAHIPGLVTAGDRVLPLVDLAELLGLGDDRGGDGDPLFRRVLFVRVGDLEAGLVCERARGLVAVAEASLRPASVLAGDRLRPYLAAELDGDAGGVVGLIDLGALLAAAAIT